MAFEPLIYRNLLVYSDEENNSKRQHGISLANLQQITSGHRVIRQTWIRNLEYIILAPYKILTWTNPDNYFKDKPFRDANDLAGEGNPELSSLHWPHLRILEVECVQGCLVGKVERKRTPPRMPETIAEHFHRLLISLGSAAQRMPRSKSLKFHVQAKSTSFSSMSRISTRLPLDGSAIPNTSQMNGSPKPGILIQLT